MRWLDGFTDAMDMNLGKLWEMMRASESWRAAAPGVSKCQTRLGDSAITTMAFSPLVCMLLSISVDVAFYVKFKC